MSVRPVEQIVSGMATQDGAGVQLTRILGSSRLDHVDPFLLLDEFKSNDPNDYIAGFPSHPHRGFETVTYLKHGNFRRKDSRGNEGFLVPGSVQWMTAGRGIVHSEMPEQNEGLLWGFQLWINLPSSLKMIDPRYQDIPPDQIPVVAHREGNVKVIAGEFSGARGPAETHLSVIYFDVALSANEEFVHPVASAMNCLSYLYEGRVVWDRETVEPGHLIVAGAGDEIRVQTEGGAARFLLIAADRIGEPIARAGPFVMNTDEELHRAFSDYQAGILTD